MPQHSETRRLPYTPDQMYGLVADVASYPAFIPWTAAARIRSVTPLKDGSGEVMLADLVIGFRMFRERFGSRVTLHPDQRRINTESIDGPFKHMKSFWEFAGVEGGCDVRFEVDFEFRNRLLQGAAGMFFHDAMTRIVRAFEARAAQFYQPDQQA
ncbi:MAG: type II toxin-antitoxin system RatA family toxin [Rhodobacteraceae bacterium]|nr:type II toxin-antitoxin system RatA family toxin [Paracoccaceae bacterium]